MKLVIKAAKTGMEYEFIGTREELIWLVGEEGVRKLRDKMFEVSESV